MATNNKVELTGNLGDDVKVIETEERTFATARIATTDSYKDEKTDQWIDLQTVWHNIIIFSPAAIEYIKPLKKGARIKVAGSLSYKPRLVQQDGKEFSINEASIIVRSVEQAPLIKKS